MSKGRSASKDASLSLLGGLMTLKVDVVPAKMAEERVEFKLICPDEDEPTRPVQMYIHPDDVDVDKPRMWTVSECDRAREVDGILYRVTDDDIAGAREPLLPTGEIGITAFPAEQVEAVSRPNGQLYRLRCKAQPGVYAMVRTLIETSPHLAFIGEMTIRGNQRMYRAHSWGDQIVLQEMVRPGEFYDGEPVVAEFDDKLLATARQAIESNVSDFDPDAFASFLRDRAAALDEAMRDPNAPKPQATPKPVEVDDTAGLMALLEAAAKSAPKKPGRKKAS